MFLKKSFFSLILKQNLYFIKNKLPFFSQVAATVSFVLHLGYLSVGYKKISCHRFLIQMHVILSSFSLFLHLAYVQCLLFYNFSCRCSYKNIKKKDLKIFVVRRKLVGKSNAKAEKKNRFVFVILFRCSFYF